ncbi:MAG: type IV pilus twitching motility protein PilT, partial [Verrucomicrobiae bacterium]|nr:type IV pilus twitching motility protein PilT [Verrucomicrobiae bacterium]
TGHLVLTTLHTTTAYQAIGRILDFFPAHERDQIRRQLAVNLQAVICQRLVPAIAGGVVPAVEIMINTPIVRKLIEDNQLDKLHAAIETGTEDVASSLPPRDTTAEGSDIRAVVVGVTMQPQRKVESETNASTTSNQSRVRVAGWR